MTVTIAPLELRQETPPPVIASPLNPFANWVVHAVPEQESVTLAAGVVYAADEPWMIERGLSCCAPHNTVVTVLPFKPHEFGYVESMATRIERWERNLHQRMQKEVYTATCTASRSGCYTSGEYTPGSEYAAFRPVPGQWGCR